MSLLGLDVGTSGCKAAVFSIDGRRLASAYAEYDYRVAEAGTAELDPAAIWKIIRQTLRRAATSAAGDPVSALAVSSMGEAVVPVTRKRRVLGPSLLNFDQRGAEYLPRLRGLLEEDLLYRTNGNTLSNQYSLTKLMWIQDHQPDLFEQTELFLHWGPFIAFMLGAEAVLDYTLASRTLLFDLDRREWSQELLGRTGIPVEKLPPLAPSGTRVGTVSDRIADELGLPHNVAVVTGAHDQCANALGSGAIEPGRAFFGMGSYHCIAPIMGERRRPEEMIPRGLCTEHHVVPGCFLTFIYNHGGTVVKWYRDTFAAAEARRAKRSREDLYSLLIAELPEHMSSVIVLPTFAPTGTPDFISDTCGQVVGLHLDTQRGDILRGILEGVAFYLKSVIDTLPGAGITIEDFRVVGGGSKSDRWIQICADIFGRPFTRPVVTEAGALGSAIVAGVGSGVYPDFTSGVQAMVKPDRRFEPNWKMHERYRARGEQYQDLARLMKSYLSDLHLSDHLSGAEGWSVESLTK